MNKRSSCGSTPNRASLKPASGQTSVALANMLGPTLLHRADGSQFALGASAGAKIMPAVVELSRFLLRLRGGSGNRPFTHRATDIEPCRTSPSRIRRSRLRLDRDVERDAVKRRDLHAARNLPLSLRLAPLLSAKGYENTPARQRVMSAWGDAMQAPEKKGGGA